MLRAFGSLLAPPLCGVCSAPCRVDDPLCDACDSALRAARTSVRSLPGLDVIAASGYDGVARRLVSAVKFSGRIALIDVAARAVAAAWERHGAPPGVVVPVPASPARTRSRGFDPVYGLGRLVQARTTGSFAAALRRDDGPRQVGRTREQRLQDPPRVRVPGGSRAGGSFLLVDDVITTGATLSACAAALRLAGATDVAALVFAASE